MVLLLRDSDMSTVTTPSSPLKMEYFALQTDFPSYPRYLYINPYITVNLPSSSLFPLSSATTAAAPLLVKKIDSDSVPPQLTIPIQTTFNHSLMKLETEIPAAFSPSDVGIAVAEPLSPSELSQGIESLPFSDESDNAGCRPTKHYLPGLLHKDTPHLEVDNCFNNKTHSDIQEVVQDSTNWPEVNTFNQQRLNSFADFNYDGHYFAASDFLNMLTAPRCSPSSSFPSSGNIHVLAPTRCLRSVCPEPILRYFHERSGSTWIEEPPGFWFQPPLLIPSHGHNVICSQEREGYSRKDDGCPQLLDLIPEDGVWTYFTPSFFPQDQGQVAVNKESSQTSSNRAAAEAENKVFSEAVHNVKDQEGQKGKSDDYISFVSLHADPRFGGIFYVEKENVRVLLRQDSTFWTSRPVAELRVRVAADDVLFLLHINHEMIKKINGRSLCELLIWKSLIGFLLFDSNCGDKDLSHAAFLVTFHTSVSYFYIGSGISLAYVCVIDDGLLMVPHLCNLSLNLVIFWWCSWPMKPAEYLLLWAMLYEVISGSFVVLGDWQIEHHFVNGSIVGVQWFLLDYLKIFSFPFTFHPFGVGIFIGIRVNVDELKGTSIPLIWFFGGPNRVHSFSWVFSTLFYALGQRGSPAFGTTTSIPDHPMFSSTLPILYGLVIDIVTTYYPALVIVLVYALMSFAGRILLVDGSLSVPSYSVMIPLKQEFMSSEIPNLQFHSVEILIAIVKDWDSQVLPHVADIIELLKEYLRSCKAPDLEIKSYLFLKILGAEQSQRLESYFQIIPGIEMIDGELLNGLAALRMLLSLPSALLGVIMIAWGNAVVEHKMTRRLFEWNLAWYGSSISFIVWHSVIPDFLLEVSVLFYTLGNLELAEFCAAISISGLCSITPAFHLYGFNSLVVVETEGCNGLANHLLNDIAKVTVKDRAPMLALRLFKGDFTPATLPKDSLNSHPLLIMVAVDAVRNILLNGILGKQVLVQWEGLQPENDIGEDAAIFTRDSPTFHLEDKVIFEDSGNDTPTDLDRNTAQQPKEKSSKAPSPQPK